MFAKSIFCGVFWESFENICYIEYVLLVLTNNRSFYLDIRFDVVKTNLFCRREFKAFNPETSQSQNTPFELPTQQTPGAIRCLSTIWQPVNYFLFFIEKISRQRTIVPFKIIMFSIFTCHARSNRTLLPYASTSKMVRKSFDSYYISLYQYYDKFTKLVNALLQINIFRNNLERNIYRYPSFNTISL